MNLSESDRSYVKHKRSRLLRHASDTGEARRSEPGGRRSGQVLILMSLVVSSMLVMGGLLLDGGRLYFVKSRSYVIPGSCDMRAIQAKRDAQSRGDVDRGKS